MATGGGVARTRGVKRIAGGPWHVREQARLRGRPRQGRWCIAVSRTASPATRGPRLKNLPALLVEALNEPVVVTIDGERREITKREEE